MSGCKSDLGGPNGSVGEYGYFGSILIAAITLALCHTGCGGCRSGGESPCAVCVILGLGKYVLYRAVKLGGINDLTLGEMSGCKSDLGGPNGSVGEYGYCNSLGCAAFTSLLRLTLCLSSGSGGQGIGPGVGDHLQGLLYGSIHGGIDLKTCGCVGCRSNFFRPNLRIGKRRNSCFFGFTTGAVADGNARILFGGRCLNSPVGILVLVLITAAGYQQNHR